MRPDPPPSFDSQVRPERDTANAKWTIGGLLALVTALLLSSLALSNITAEGPAKRSIGLSLAILTEVDAFLDAEYDGLRERAEATTDDVALTDFPIPVTFTPEEVLSMDRERFRGLLLARASDRVHNDGASALRDGRGDEGGLFSTEGVLRRGLDLLRPTPHRIFFGLTVALAIVAACLAATLLLVTRGYGRMLSLGASVLLAAAPFLAFAVGVRFALRLAADGADDYVSREFLELVEELAWAPIRNGIIVSVAAAATALAGSTLARWNDARNL